MSNVSAFHILIAIALAITIVIVPMGETIMILPWIIFVSFVYRKESRRGRGISTLMSYVTITIVVVVLAVLAPVKTTERVLDRRMILPRTAMTLEELDRDTNFVDAHWLPRSIHVSSKPEDADQVIRFRDTDVTLREFIATIEKQSNLRHRFLNCGNGSSILFGGDCCFGLWLR